MQEPQFSTLGPQSDMPSSSSSSHNASGADHHMGGDGVEVGVEEEDLDQDEINAYDDEESTTTTMHSTGSYSCLDIFRHTFCFGPHFSGLHTNSSPHTREFSFVTCDIIPNL